LVAAVFSELIQRDGSVAMTAHLNHGGFKATNVADPTAAQDAATKNYVDTTAVAAVNAEAAARAAADTALTNSTNSAIAAEATARTNADATKVSKSGDTMTGNLAISNTAPTIDLVDTDQGVTKKLHHNSNLIGFLSNDGSWLLHGNDGGQVWTRNYGWLHDFFFYNVSNCWRNGGTPSAAFQGAPNCQITDNCYNCGDQAPTGGYVVPQIYDGGGTVRFGATGTRYNCNCCGNC
jgi:hypothetical protein